MTAGSAYCAPQHPPSPVIYMSCHFTEPPSTTPLASSPLPAPHTGLLWMGTVFIHLSGSSNVRSGFCVTAQSPVDFFPDCMYGKRAWKLLKKYCLFPGVAAIMSVICPGVFFQAMKGEKGMAGVAVGEGLSEDLSEDSFSKWNTGRVFSLHILLKPLRRNPNKFLCLPHQQTHCQLGSSQQTVSSRTLWCTPLHINR